MLSGAKTKAQTFLLQTCTLFESHVAFRHISISEINEGK